MMNLQARSRVPHALQSHMIPQTILVPRAYDLLGQRWNRWALVSAITGCREIHDIRSACLIR